MTKRVLGLVLAFAACACSRQPSDISPGRSRGTAPNTPPEASGWLLTGTPDERFARIARQLRGFDVAMVETGHRYGELYWAGQDRNWDYASYQIEKIRTAVKNGIERRPKRGPSAQMLEPALAAVEQAVHARDPALFVERFGMLTTTCNACHQAERVPFVRIGAPTVRSSPAALLPTGGRD